MVLINSLGLNDIFGYQEFNTTEEDIMDNLRELWDYSINHGSCLIVMTLIPTNPIVI